MALGACETAPERPAAGPPHLTLEAVEFAALPGWQDDDLTAALPALRRSCAKPAREAGALAGIAGAEQWPATLAQACAALAQAGEGDAAAARRYFERWFRPYRVGDGRASEGLFTGYYEPELRGSLRAGARFGVPLYGEPHDLIAIALGDYDEELKGKRITAELVGARLRPYPTRAEIEAGALKGKAPELVYVADPIEAFFLEIQGSGRVLLEGGGVLHLGYAGSNGRRYRAIGRLLVERGIMALEEVTAQSLKAWLRAHPVEAKALMDENDAYVFFRVLTGDGPIGAEGVVLTPGRSLAVDPRFLPFGLPLWLDLASPEPGARIRNLVVAQDAGSAIKGPVRGDLFWGHGGEAEAMAGRMRSAGSYYLLLPRPEGPLAAE